jgi:hypothetical protein
MDGDDHHLHGWTDGELDAALAGLNPVEQVRVLRRAVKSATATAAFYGEVIHDIGARWGALITPPEIDWFRDRLLSGTQDLVLEVAAQIRLDQRRAQRDDDHG